jgi:hypothetical protein
VIVEVRLVAPEDVRIAMRLAPVVIVCNLPCNPLAAHTIAAARVIVVDPAREEVRIALRLAPGVVLCSCNELAAYTFAEPG